MDISGITYLEIDGQDVTDCIAQPEVVTMTHKPAEQPQIPERQGPPPPPPPPPVQRKCPCCK